MQHPGQPAATAQVTLTPIGVVRGGRAEIVEDHWGDVVARIVLDPGQLAPDATAGLTEFSHVEVVLPAWMRELMREYY